MRAPIDLAKATPALIAFFEISEPSVGIKMCLNMLASFRAGPTATLPGAGSDELIQIKESPARKTIGARRVGWRSPTKAPDSRPALGTAGAFRASPRSPGPSE